MRVLHLFSNFKWTGPADPAVTIAAGVRALGIETVFRSSGYTKGGGTDEVAPRARERGLDVRTDLHLAKHRSFLLDRADVRALASILRAEGIDLVHSHLPNDFRIAHRARRGAATPPLVRTVYDTDPNLLPRREIPALTREAEAVLTFTGTVANHLAASGVDPARIHRVDPSVDLERFDPKRPLPEFRPRLGFSKEDFLVGIVARVQPHRRFDLLLDMASILAARCPAFRLVVIGRGSKLDRVARDPARERGLLDRVVFFPGYFTDDAYVAVLRMLDVKLFLVPGTDGTARAVREALASGRPVVATRRGMLPDLVRDAKTGRIVEETPEAFANAIFGLFERREERLAMGKRAREDACVRFDPRRQAEAVAAVYRKVVGSAIPAEAAASGERKA